MSSTSCNPEATAPGASTGTTVAGLLASMQDRLGDHREARLEAELLLSHVLDCARSRLFAWPEAIVSTAQATLAQALTDRRAKGEPIAHLLGHCEFWSLSLTASPAALIPRPATELLVELAIRHATPDQTGRLLDLGTGSGAIGLAFASERPNWQVIGTDLDLGALAQARRDASRLGIYNMQFLGGNWFGALDQRPGGSACDGQPVRFDIIVANPPYVDRNDAELDAEVRRFEPPLALFAEDQGLAAINTIARQAPRYLHADSWLLLEHGWRQAEAVERILRSRGFDCLTRHRDLAGHPRAFCARWPASDNSLSSSRPAPTR